MAKGKPGASRAQLAKNRKTSPWRNSSLFDKAGRVKRSPSATFDSEQSVRLRENMHSPPEIDVNPLLEERETATRHVSYSFGDDFSDD